jgi:hypothetical protein
MTDRWRGPLALGAALCAAACGGAEEPAITEERRPLHSVEDVSAELGFSLSQVLPAGEFSGTLSWEQAPEGEGIHFVPSRSQTKVRWGLNLPVAPSIQEVVVSCDRSRFVTNTRRCDSRLEAKLVLHIETDDGAFQENLPVDLTAYDISYVVFKHMRVSLANINGSFELSAAGAYANTVALDIIGNAGVAQIAEGIIYGSVVTDQDHSSQTGRVFTVAKWIAESDPIGHTAEF